MLPPQVRVKPALFILKNLEEGNIDWSWMQTDQEDVEEPEEVIQERESPNPTAAGGVSKDELFQTVEPKEQEQYLFTKANERELYESRMPYMDGSEDGEDAIEPTVTEKIMKAETQDESHDAPIEPKLPETGCFRPEGGGEEDIPEVVAESEIPQSVPSKEEGSLTGACSQCNAGDNSVPDTLPSHSSDIRNESGVRKVNDVTAEGESRIKMVDSGNISNSAAESKSINNIFTTKKDLDNTHDKSAAESDLVSDSLVVKKKSGGEGNQANLDEPNVSSDQNCIDNVHIGVGIQSNSCNKIHNDMAEQRSKVSETMAQVYENDKEEEEYESTDHTNNPNSELYSTSKDNDNKGINDEYDSVRNDEELGLGNIESIPDDGMVNDEKIDSVRNSMKQDILDENKFIGVTNVGIDEDDNNNDDERISEADNVDDQRDYEDISQTFYETDEDINIPLDVEYLDSKEVKISDFDNEDLVSNLIIDENTRDEKMNDEEISLDDKNTIYVDDEYFVEYIDDDIKSDGENGVSNIEDVDEFNDYFYDPRIVIDVTDDENYHDFENDIEDTDDENIPLINNEYINDVHDENVIEDNDKIVFSDTHDENGIEETNDNILIDEFDHEYTIENNDEKLVDVDHANIFHDTDDENMNESTNVNIVHETDDGNLSTNKVEGNESNNLNEVKSKNVGDKDDDDIVTHRNEKPMLDMNTKEPAGGGENIVPNSDHLQATDITKPAEHDEVVVAANDERYEGENTLRSEGDDNNNLEAERKHTSCEMHCSTVDTSDSDANDGELMNDKVNMINDNNDDDNGDLFVIDSAADSVLSLKDDDDDKANTVIKKTRVVSNTVDDVEEELTPIQTKDIVDDIKSSNSNSYTSNTVNVHDCINNSVPEIDSELPEDQQQELKTITPQEIPLEHTPTEDSSEEEEGRKGGKETRFVEVTVNLEENEPSAGVSEVSAKHTSPQPQLTPGHEENEDN